MALAPDYRSPFASVATGASLGITDVVRLATAGQQGDGVTFAFFFRKRHNSPAAGGYPQASTTKAAAGLWDLHQ
jgi:hypothetical protein